MRSRVELFENIRKDWRLDEPSIRELAERHKVHRRTIRQALADAVPPPRKVYPVRPRPAIDEWVAVIDAWLMADRDAPRKQRHTARRVWQRLSRSTLRRSRSRPCRVMSRELRAELAAGTRRGHHRGPPWARRGGRGRLR